MRRGQYYRIRKGDTLYRISKVHGVDIDSLMAINEIRNPQDIREGRLLYIPTTSPPIPYENVGLKRASRTKPKSRHHRRQAQKFRLPKDVELAWPLRGKILTKFGKTGKHRYDGINIEGRWGQEVRAVYPGTVVYSGDGVKGYGNMIIVRHKARLYSIYALNAENLVSKGDTVKKSQVIAKVGGLPKIGKSFLHFQLRSGKKAVDPLPVLK